jgi:hypothetical protein
MSQKRRWIFVAVFAAAMAWMESAAVAYLRTVVDRVEPYQPDPLPIAPRLGEAELVREFATLVMLFAAGWLAGSTRRTRLGYSLIAFGVWDILYYVFLKIITGWPHSIWDWDVLFLLPLPWWGPVIAPVAIAAIMILFGTLAIQLRGNNQALWPSRWAWRLNLSGVALALFVFMSDAIYALDGGIEAIRNTLPNQFNWLLFILALALIAAPIGDIFNKVWRSGRKMEIGPGKLRFRAQSLLLILLYKIISNDG